MTTTAQPRPEDHLKLAYKVAHRVAGGLQQQRNKYSSARYDFEDIIQEAMLALVKACRGFDPSFGLKFSTYAVPYITGCLLTYMRNNACSWYRSKADREAKIFPWTASIDGMKNVNRTTNSMTELTTLPDTHNESEKWSPSYRETDYDTIDTLLSLPYMTDTEKKIVSMSMLEYSQREIAEALGRDRKSGQVWVSRRIKRIHDRMQSMEAMQQ